MKRQFGMVLLLCLFMQSIMFGSFSLKYLDKNEIESEENINYPVEVIETKEIKNPSWIVYYGNNMPVSNFYNYDPIVFYQRKHPLLAPLLVKQKTVLAFLSLGDIESEELCYTEAKAEKLFTEKNPEDSDRVIIDIRNPKWEELLVSRIIPIILEEGFSGLCLCNLDAALNLEQENPEKYAGMKDAAISLLAKIKELYGDYTLMLDMGGLLHLGQEVLPYADMLLYEHLFTEKHGKSVTLARAQNYLMNAQKLQELAQAKEGMRVYTLDFWPQKDKAVIKNIYNKQRSYGFIPYVAENVSTIAIEPQ